MQPREGFYRPQLACRPRLVALIRVHQHVRQPVDGNPVVCLGTLPCNSLQLMYPRGDLGVMQQLVRFFLLGRQRAALRIAGHGKSLPRIAEFNVCVGKGFLPFCKRRHCRFGAQLIDRYNLK